MSIRTYVCLPICTFLSLSMNLLSYSLTSVFPHFNLNLCVFCSRIIRSVSLCYVYLFEFSGSLATKRANYGITMLPLPL